MQWQAIRGHQQTIERFRRSFERGRLSHSYLFLGPGGIGKKRFALTLAQTLLCRRSTSSGPALPGMEPVASELSWEPCEECSSCKRVAAATHPDLLVVGRLEGKSELTLEVFAGRKENRGREGLCYELSLSPMAGDRKIAIIDDADSMNEESGNALLKTLEEPPPNSILILIAENIDGILPTIRSRCQQIRFAPLAPGDLVDLMIETGMIDDRGEAEQVAALSDGGLNVAEQLIDPTLRQLRTMLYGHLSAGNFNPIAATTGATAGIDQLGGDTATQRRNAGWLLRFALEFYRAASLRLAGQTNGPNIPEVDRFVASLRNDVSLNLELVMELFDRVAQADSQLDRRTPIPLCFEGLFDDLARKSRNAGL